MAQQSLFAELNSCCALRMRMDLQRTSVLSSVVERVRETECGRCTNCVFNERQDGAGCQAIRDEHGECEGVIYIMWKGNQTESYEPPIGDLTCDTEGLKAAFWRGYGKGESDGIARTKLEVEVAIRKLLRDER